MKKRNSRNHNLKNKYGELIISDLTDRLRNRNPANSRNGRTIL